MNAKSLFVKLAVTAFGLSLVASAAYVLRGVALVVLCLKGCAR